MRPHRLRLCVGSALVALTMLCTVPGSSRSSAQERPESKPSEAHTRLGLVEKTGVSLTLIDVEVTDPQGRPIRGLHKEDFRIWLTGREWPIYSLDDLCDCEEPAAGARAGSKGSPAPASPRERVTAEPSTAKTDAVSESGNRTGETQSPGGASDAPGADGSPHSGGPPEGPAGAEPELRFALFFDLGHLAVDGRKRAFEEARRWIRDVRRPGDMVGIWAHAPRAGLRTIQDFTPDRGLLLAALDRIEPDPTLQESWPSFHRDRWAVCLAAGATGANRFGGTADADAAATQCLEHLEEETRRGVWSITGLTGLVESFEAYPGRKALILFNQTGTLQTGSIYPDVRLPRRVTTLRTEASDNVKRAEKLAAEATLARTTINTAYVGDRLSATPDQPAAVDLANGALALGAVLAESTGGTHNLDLSDLQAMTTAVRTHCACIYRIGLEARADEPHGRIYKARIKVRGKALKPRYRVAFLSELDLWIRQARSVLRNPARARELAVGAAILPVRASGGAWDLAIQVGLDMRTVDFVPASGATVPNGASSASWEAGAWLLREDDDADWELLGVASARRHGGGRTGSAPDAVLHEHLFHNLLPGRYRLAAFVKDRASSLYGGAEANLEIPSPRSDALAGPVLQLASKRHLTAPLPPFRKKSDDAEHALAPRSGPMPAMGRAAERGEPLLAVSWLCPGRKKQDPQAKPTLLRHIAKNGAPIFRLDDPRVEPAGDCLRVIDRLETTELMPGAYTYTLEYRPVAGSPPVVRTAPFVITAPPASPIDSADASP